LDVDDGNRRALTMIARSFFYRAVFAEFETNLRPQGHG
jgi:hypothetical protein